MLRKTFLFCSALSACISLAMIGAACWRKSDPGKRGSS
jgi:hypothetical protein